MSSPDRAALPFPYFVVATHLLRRSATVDARASRSPLQLDASACLRFLLFLPLLRIPRAGSASITIGSNSPLPSLLLVDESSYGWSIDELSVGKIRIAAVSLFRRTSSGHRRLHLQPPPWEYSSDRLLDSHRLVVSSFSFDHELLFWISDESRVYIRTEALWEIEKLGSESLRGIWINEAVEARLEWGGCCLFAFRHDILSERDNFIGIRALSCEVHFPILFRSDIEFCFTRF